MTFSRTTPALFLAGALAASAIVSAPSLQGFSLLGGSLGVATTSNGYQRDVRIQNNSTDPASNNNTAPEAAFPGAVGAPLAVWKALREWASDAPQAAKKFDYDWQGLATSNNANQNTVGWNQSCGGGTLAFTETPISDGWRIIMCTEWNWADGPGNIGGGEIDIQGVVAHELGHALGLGHSSTNCGGSCTTYTVMCPAICGNGVGARTIKADDAAGLQAIYGAIPANKPVITGISGSFQVGGSLTITGQNFAPTVNVKFTAETSTNTGAIPGVVFNVPTTGTSLTVTIPAAAKKGNVFVWEPALSRLSNGVPIDVGGVPPAPPIITNVSPNVVQAFSPGTVTITGTNFASVSNVTVGGSSISFTVVNGTTITFNPAAPANLGPLSVTVTNPQGTSNAGTLTFVETNPPQLSAFGFAISGSPFSYTFGGPSNDSWFLILSVNPATVPFGSTNILAQHDAAFSGLLPANGIGGHGITIPPGTAGLTFYSQLLTWDGGLQLLGSNVVTSNVIF